MLYLSTACVSADDSATALDRLARLGATHAFVPPGRALGDRWRAESEPFGDRLLLHHAYMAPSAAPRWNLAASEEHLRKRAISEATEALKHASEQGSPFYSLHPGYALDNTYGPDGKPAGREQPRARAIDQLCRSLDRLAAVADNLGIGLLVENMAGGRTPTVHLATPPLWQEPSEITQTLERLNAPPLGLLFDVGHWLLSCRARRWEPEPALDEILPWVRAISLSRNDSAQDLHQLPQENGIELELAKRAGGLMWPVILTARDLEPEAIAWASELIAETLTPQIFPQRA